MKKHDIQSLFNEWNLALQTRDPKKIAALYECDAILLSTLLNKVHRNHKDIEDYFDFFLQREPTGRIVEENIRLFDSLAINSGIYIFTLKDNMSIRARFTFVYRWNGTRWMIVEHHSSQMPQ
jgi:uncharacterized protein (TIGR02246 family)